MPKTRNVTRSQGHAANASLSTTSRRKRDENETGYESEKENSGRQGTRRTHRRGGVLGATNPTATILGASTTTSSKAPLRTATRGKAPPKGKPTAAPVKQKKAPLQDITAQFLPAPESANRGEGYEGSDSGNEDTLVIEPTTNTVTATTPPDDVGVPLERAPPKFASPLPPSSPPSDWISSPVLHRKETQHTATLMDPATASDHEAYDPWQDLDDAARPASGGSQEREAETSNSDPFGFVALERKLKQEREMTPHDDIYGEGDYEDLGNVLVADTSSPRPVRRLKRVHEDAEEDKETEDENPDEASVPPVISHPRFSTPPTPHKDKQKRRRLSHEGHDVFSPCSSSIESSPSPTKASARKHALPEDYGLHDPLDEFNDEVDRSCGPEAIVENLPLPKRTHRAPGVEDVVDADDEANDSIAKHLRPRRIVAPAAEKKEIVEKKRAKSSVRKGKLSKKPVSKSTQKEVKAETSDEEDADEKWEKARQERLEYFKRLEGYEVEKEDVYLI